MTSALHSLRNEIAHAMRGASWYGCRSIGESEFMVASRRIAGAVFLALLLSFGGAWGGPWSGAWADDGLQRFEKEIKPKLEFRSLTYAKASALGDKGFVLEGITAVMPRRLRSRAAASSSAKLRASTPRVLATAAVFRASRPAAMGCRPRARAASRIWRPE